MFLSNSSAIAPFTGFEQKLCAFLRIAPDRYLEAAFRRTLYPHARVLRSFVELFAPDFFAADRDFLVGVGQLWRRRDFAVEVWDYQYHPANRGFLRRNLRLRVSVRRVQKLVELLLADAALGDLGVQRASRANEASAT